METSEKISKHRNSWDMTFTKFKNDIHHIIDDTKNIIIYVEELEDDFKHCYKKCLFKMFLKQNMLFFGVRLMGYVGNISSKSASPFN